MADDLSTTLLSSGNLAGAGNFLTAYGQYTQGQSYLEHGAFQNAVAQTAAQQMRQNASDAAAAAQRASVDTGRQAEFIASKQLAVAAASGGGASDPTVMNIIARTHGEMAYRQAVQIYGGESQRRALLNQANAERFTGAQELAQGKQASFAADVAAGTTLLKGSRGAPPPVSLRDKYGAGGPTSTTVKSDDDWVYGPE